MTLLSLVLAAPASADTVTPVRHCGYGDRYVELDGGYSAFATAPDGYLIASFCVDSGRRRGSSEVHTLSTPQRTTAVWHSEGRRLEGYSVEYIQDPASEEPEADSEEDDESEPAESEPAEDDEASESTRPEAKHGDKAKEKETAPADVDQKDEKAERTPSADPSESEPSRQASAQVSAPPDETSQMSALSDGEELRITSLEDEDDSDDEDLRSLVVAGGIILVGLLAGAIALLVRIPGQR